MDWSGALSGAASKIWIARALNGVLVELLAPGSRDAVCDVLVRRASDPLPCLVGLDFAFAFPAWYARDAGYSHVTELWTAARDCGEVWLRKCEPPFWGRPGTKRPYPAEQGLRSTEQSKFKDTKPKSAFQIGGAGSVGTGSVRGMPMLLALQKTGWSIWPFDAPSSHTICEIYPRIFTGPVVKSSAAARAEYLAHAHLSLAQPLRQLMMKSEDAFDAGVSAIQMSLSIEHERLSHTRTALQEIEGEIWVPSWQPDDVATTI